MLLPSICVPVILSVSALPLHDSDVLSSDFCVVPEKGYINKFWIGTVSSSAKVNPNQVFLLENFPSFYTWSCEILFWLKNKTDGSLEHSHLLHLPRGQIWRLTTVMAIALFPSRVFWGTSPPRNRKQPPGQQSTGRLKSTRNHWT